MKHNNIRLYLRNGECYFKFKNQSYFVGERKDIDIKRIFGYKIRGMLDVNVYHNIKYGMVIEFIKRVKF